MDPRFLQYLFNKPDIYVLAWMYFYASSRDGCFKANPSYILSRFKISRTTLQRIVDYGCAWSEDGQKVGRKWADNKLEINFEKLVSGQKVGRKRAESNRVKQDVEPPAQQVENILVKQALDIYNDFCIKQIGVGAKVDGIQIKSLKSIIAYLRTQVKNESDKDTAIKDAWTYILTNWSVLDNWHKQQIKLSQINSNLPNILSLIRKSKKNDREAKYASSTNQVRPEDFDGTAG